MIRQTFLLFCFLTVMFLAFVNASTPVVGSSPTAQTGAQTGAPVSPLASPLATPAATATLQALPTATNLPISVPANGSSISVVLIGAVLLGILVVTALVIWRRR